jgi:hypothetical protein
MMTDDIDNVADSAAKSKADEASTSTPADPFDPASLRISSAAVPSYGVKKLLLTIPVKKPDKQIHVRVHPSADYRLLTAVIELRADNEVYLVSPNLREVLATEITLVTLFTAMDRPGNLFLWYVKMPKEDGRPNQWTLSALDVAEEAMKAWIRVLPNQTLGVYEAFRAESILPEPEWPDLKLNEILKIAFRDRFIESLDHPVIAKLQGRA